MQAYENDARLSLCPAVLGPTDSRPDCGGTPDETAFLRGLVQGMRCGILVIDVESRIVLLNDHGRRILEVARPTAGSSVSDGLGSHPELVRVLSRAFDRVSLPNRAELTLGRGRRDGKTIGFTLSHVRSESGAICGAAMFFKDLTQIEHTEEQQRLKDRLAQLGQMAANMAHEIRNPLASIEVSCKLLGRRLGQDDGCRELLKKITDEVRRLNRSVDSSLRFVRPVNPSFRAHDLMPLLEEAIRAAEDRRGAPGIRVRRRLAGNIPPFLMDPDLLQQVFVNLVLNAMEAVGGEGTVTIEAERIEASRAAGGSGDPWSTEHYVIVRVSDTGPGISEENQDRIFYPFFTTKEQGSGVGLAMARKIVGSHHGLIGIESAPGEGASLVVRLPMVTEDVEE